jgi:asparagine synthase (glutamine-hydrolysing)
LDDILVKVDRMSMAHSLEVRSPLLDYKLAELAAQMPTRMKIRNGSGKYILRELMRNHLPKSSLRKGKQGFSVPLRDWFRGKLSTMVNDYLLPGGYLPEEIFNATTVHRILMEHQRGVLDHSRKIWLLLAFASWHRQYQRDGIGAIVANARRSEVLPCAS